MILPTFDDLEPREVIRPLNDDRSQELNSRYLVTNRGRVWSLYSGRWLKKEIGPKGYERIEFSLRSTVKGKGLSRRYRRFVHRLVMQAFEGLPGYPDPTVDHLNEIKTDNRLENLEWVTRAENSRRAIQRRE